MTVNLDQLHKYGIDGDPKVRKQKTAAENTDKVIVVGDRFAVLKAGGGTRQDVYRDKDPVAHARGAQIREERDHWAVNE